MAKAVKYSTIAAEIKKEYLKEHLENVKRLIVDWLPQLNAEEPLTPRKGDRGWNSAYRPSTEQDPDSNHMLRRHLRSRALWSHHADWERKLDSILNLANQLQRISNEKHVHLSNGKRWQYNDEYVVVALWQAFNLAYRGKMFDLYKEPDDKHGLNYGGYKIELIATSTEDRSVLETEHREFIGFLTDRSEMQDLIKVWDDVIKLQERMQSISNKALKSGDILYTCQFCRHLWK